MHYCFMTCFTLSKSAWHRSLSLLKLQNLLSHSAIVQQYNTYLHGDTEYGFITCYNLLICLFVIEQHGMMFFCQETLYNYMDQV